MSTVTGQIEAISTKYGKFSIMVNDNWYGTKQEWAPNPLPNRGDVVEFDDGGKNFLKKLRIKSSVVVAQLALLLHRLVVSDSPLWA
jgi:hypothetical protein